MDKQTRKELREYRNAMREHAEHYYGEEHMTKLDWVKVIAGGLFLTVVVWGFTAFMFVM